MRDVLIAALPTGLATGLGAVPVLLSKPLPRRAYDGVLGLGAGLMLAAATLGLLGEALEGIHTPVGIDSFRVLLISTGFLAGVVLAVAMDRFIPHGHARGHRGHIHAGDAEHVETRPERRHIFLVVGAISIHRLPEGVAIGAGFAVGEGQLGWMLSAAVALQNVCEGMVMSAPLRKAGMAPIPALLLVSSSGLMVPVGAAFGYVLSGLAMTALPFVLALAAGTLIYVTSNEIIPESHSHGNESTASGGLIAGFLLTMLLGALIH